MRSGFHLHEKRYEDPMRAIFDVPVLDLRGTRRQRTPGMTPGSLLGVLSGTPRFILHVRLDYSHSGSMRYNARSSQLNSRCSGSYAPVKQGT